MGNPVSANSEVYRGIRNPSWYRGDKLLAVAFELRVSETGLSVFTTDTCPTQDECLALIPILNTAGVASVLRAKISSLGLTVEQKRDSHDLAEIKGIPLLEDDEKAAKDIAFELAESAILRNTWKRR